jgi:predicted DNA-binding transcriptional regulator YafY
MADKSLRLIRMLELVPRGRSSSGEPKGISVREIAEALQRPWRNVEFPRQSYRTIQRDLELLAAICPGLECETRGRTYYWYWADAARMFNIPRMATEEAVALDTARSLLQGMLPQSVSDHLAPFFDVADATLGEAQRGRRGARWRDKVRVVVPSQPFLKPRIEHAIFRMVSEALFRDRQLTLVYRNREDDVKQHEHVNPLGLVYWGERPYLVVMLSGRDKPLYLALHRIERAAILADFPAQRPATFDLDQYIAEGHFGVRRGDPIKLDVRFRGKRVRQFEEMALSEDQALAYEAGWVRVRATVNDTEQLRWWLLGFGADAEVIGPERLRKQIAEAAGRLHCLYARAPQQG